MRSWSPGVTALRNFTASIAMNNMTCVDGIELHRARREDAAGLRHRLDLQHAGHHRDAREVALEVRLVERDVLEAQHPVVADLEHAIDQQEWIAMRQQPKDLLGLHRGCVGSWPLRHAAFVTRLRAYCALEPITSSRR